MPSLHLVARFPGSCRRSTITDLVREFNRSISLIYARNQHSPPPPPHASRADRPPLFKTRPLLPLSSRSRPSMPFFSRKFNQFKRRFRIERRPTFKRQPTLERQSITMSTTARTQGLYVDRVDMMEEDFQTYSPYFGGHLLALFKIRYNLPPEMSAFLEDRPLPTVYFHGTGHCGCAMNHIALGSSTHTRIPISDWCSSNAGELTNRCAAHGILTSGHLMTISRGGKSK